MRSSLRRFHSLHSLVQLARFISRAPDTHAFQQVDVAQAALVASWRALLQSGQILPFDTVGFQTYSENEEDGILLYIFLPSQGQPTKSWSRSARRMAVSAWPRT